MVTSAKQIEQMGMLPGVVLPCVIALSEESDVLRRRALRERMCLTRIAFGANMTSGSHDFEVTMKGTLMPKPTFFNLPEPKRHAIEQAALDEFSAYGFDNSNMNRIVEQSGIAKGSFYQYFEDKKDLYFHLVDRLFQKKMQTVTPIIQDYDKHSFAYNLEALFNAGLALASEDTRLYRLGEDFATLQRPFVMEFTEKYKPQAMDTYRLLLAQANAGGELRENLDLSLISVFIDALVKQTTLLLMRQQGDPAQTDHITKEMLTFIGRAILKQTQEDGQ